MKFPIVWASEKTPQVEDCETYVFPEVEAVSKNLDKAEDLIFHTIFIGTSSDGPIVMAYGKENDPNIYLDYLDDVNWVNLGDDE
jgi:hypothetical protein